MSVDARADYTVRLAQRRRRAAALARSERRIGSARLAVFAAAGGLAWLAFGLHLVPGWSLALPTVLFAALILRHAAVIPARRAADRAVAFYERGLARLDEAWAGGGVGGERYLDPRHPYAADLDLFGAGSLFELLCTARTRAGQDTLAAWLLAPAPPDEVRARQAAVAALRPRLDLREDLAVLGDALGDALHADSLAAWGGAPRRLPGAPARLAAALAALAVVGSAAAWGAGMVGPLPMLAALGVAAALGAWWRAGVRAVVRDVEPAGRDLALLARLLARIEREPAEVPRLAALRAALDSGGVAPSARIAQLERLVGLLDARRNQFFAPLAPLLLWQTQLALAIEAWRAASGAAVARWVTALGEYEALQALAAYAAEHPDDRFPSFVDGPAQLAGEGLGHPLLPAARCVRNDVRLGPEHAVLVISGSNMSGKSTLLRTIGTNVVLAQAGAPVRATRLTASALAVGTSMRVHDSLQAGTSRFYAEIQRLRQLVDGASTPPPLLFLLDEILHGTNSHDRRIGAEAVVRGLLGRGAIGCITTHDLSLAGIVDALAPRAANVHFADHLEDGVMRFDYRMQPGVVQHSNALALMRAVGLEV
ncbi:DNA mismatch repair protein MutS [bacterium]|nr:DNA mismatch repair protein MutS [bacterium]